MKNEILLVDESGVRLDKYLAERFKDISRSQLQKHVRSGDILVNGEVKPVNYRLNINDKIELDIDSEESAETHIEPQNIPLNIIFEDEDIIVVNKPAGLTVHPGVGNRDRTLANALAYHFSNLSDLNGPLRPGIVHRLDQGTSGIIVVAKNNSAHIRLAEQFSERTVDKIYYGITWGKWSKASGIISGAMARKRRDPTMYQVDMSGKKAETGFKVLKETGYFSIMNFFPKTGRTHQIRVHSAFKGHPILGDEKYGGGKSRIKGYIPEITKKMDDIFKHIDRHLLHAQKIKFNHPKSGLEISFSSDLPVDIQNIVAAIDKLNA